MSIMIGSEADAEIDVLLLKLDEIAKSYDWYDFGLPVSNDDAVDEMRKIVRQYICLQRDA